MEAPMNIDTTARSDLDVLAALNRDYINSVQHGDVRRFDEILADDFLCSNPDGSLVDKKQFLAQTARPVTISGLTAEDVKVRILGDVAIIHARTSYTTADGEQRNGRCPNLGCHGVGGMFAASVLADEAEVMANQIRRVDGRCAEPDRGWRSGSEAKAERPPKAKFAADSPLEERGFEPSVPRRRSQGSSFRLRGTSPSAGETASFFARGTGGSNPLSSSGESVSRVPSMPADAKTRLLTRGAGSSSIR
jgi:ketosteroid isomerase-like protein